jgi:DNA polymerase V
MTATGREETIHYPLIGSQLRDVDVASIRTKYGMVMEKKSRELRGDSCIDIEEVAPARRQTISSRSFGQSVAEITDLLDAVAHTSPTLP